MTDNKNFSFSYWRYKLSGQLMTLYDTVIDKKICSVNLCKYVPSVFRDDANGVGSTGSESTRYIILRKIFSHVKLKAEDSFIDIGCGKGRVLAFLKKEQAPCALNGIEINEEAGAVAKAWTKKYDNINIIIGDAFHINYNAYNVFFLGRPFLPKTFSQFIEKFENEVSHPITFIYWVDQQSGHFLKERKGWTLNYREKFQSINGLIIASQPQGFSIWTYNPNK